MKNISQSLSMGILLAGLLLSASNASAQSDKKLELHSGNGRWGFYPAKAYHEGRPRVLLIGDSVCSQYRHFVIKKLGTHADVDVWTTGGHLNSGYMHKTLTLALKQGEYQVVHFNIGLHGWSQGRIPKGEYRPLLEAYIQILKKEAPQAHCIWASTTSISETKQTPQVLDPEHNPTIVKRNAIAAQVMQENGIEVNDLYGFLTKYPELKNDRFHWKKAGSEKMAEVIAERIRSNFSVAP